MTRVALLTPCYWPEVRRGTERFAHEVDVGLIATRDDATIVTRHPGRPSTAIVDGVRGSATAAAPGGRLRRRSSRTT